MGKDHMRLAALIAAMQPVEHMGYFSMLPVASECVDRGLYDEAACWPARHRYSNAACVARRNLTPRNGIIATV